MAESGGLAMDVSLGDDCGDVVLTLDGARIQIRSGAGIVAHTNGNTKTSPALDDDEEAKATPQVGDRMPDGTVYAGISPETNRPMYTTQEDAPLTYKFNQARNHASKLDANGHKDWRVPTHIELAVLFKNRAVIGGFNLSGSYPAGWYWSSSEGYYNLAFTQCFHNGIHASHAKYNDSSLRCVR